MLNFNHVLFKKRLNSFGTVSCAGNLTIPGDGGTREFMVGLPPNTALRAQARAGTVGWRNLILCSDQSVLGGGLLGEVLAAGI